MKDTYGNIPVVGDRIVYGVSSGSTVNVWSAVVLEVLENKMYVRVTDNSWWKVRDGKPVIRDTWLRSNNFVIV